MGATLETVAIMTRSENKKQSTKQIIKAYLSNNDFTAFCRAMKNVGVTKRSDIYNEICANYSDAYLRRRNLSAYRIAYDFLKSDLDKKAAGNSTCEPSNFLQEMKKNKAAGNYKKILIEGGSHIWWVSPVYLHEDYNKAIFGKNNAENRRRMGIINAFLMK